MILVIYVTLCHIASCMVLGGLLYYLVEQPFRYSEDVWFAAIAVVWVILGVAASAAAWGTVFTRWGAMQ